MKSFTVIILVIGIGSYFHDRSSVGYNMMRHSAATYLTRLALPFPINLHKSESARRSTRTNVSD